MGWKYEVSAWVLTQNEKYYHYQTQYAGDNIFKALWVAVKARIKITKCVQLVWR